jgi:hypothetical protein
MLRSLVKKMFRALGYDVVRLGHNASNVDHTDSDEITQLRIDHDGYKHAYETVAAELGNLRMTAAPVLRNNVDEAALKDRPSVFVVTLPKSAPVHMGIRLSKHWKTTLQVIKYTDVSKKLLSGLPWRLTFNMGAW